MKITGFKDVTFGTGFYYIDAVLVSITPPILRPIRFMIDTGCHITTIGLKDSLPLTNIIPRPDSATTGAGGSSIPTSSLFNCGLAFDLVQSIHVERLSQVNFLMPIITPQNQDSVMILPSVLGMDILSRYYLKFDNISVTLEK